MNSSQVYLEISVVVLLVIFALFFFVQKRNKDTKSYKLSPLAGLSFSFILAGIIFGEDRLIGYGLMGVGVILAVIDIVIKFREKKEIQSRHDN